MSSVEVSPYWTMYHELADRSFNFEEWGLNRSGRKSHTSKPGDLASYDPTRQVIFNPLGINVHWMRNISHRVLATMLLEGPHETAGELVFCPPVGRVTLTNARLRLYPKVLHQSTFAFRLYAVAADNFCSRFVTPTYPATYKGEFQQLTYGSNHYNRRFRVDSIESDQEHTQAIVRWTTTKAAIESAFYMDTPNIASVINEVFARTGWASGQRLCLVLCHDFTGFSQEPFEPDWTYYDAGYTDEFHGVDGGSNKPMLLLEW